VEWRALGGAEAEAVRAFYGQDPVRGPACVLVIDAYNKAYGRARASILDSIAAFPSTCGEAGWDALPATQEVVACAHRETIPVIYTTGIRTPLGGIRPTRRRGVDSEWDLAIVDSLRPRAEDLVIEKPAASAFFGTTLDALLRRRRTEVLILLGETTSGCVRATAVDAFNLGFTVVVVEDAVFDRFPESHAASLFDLDLKYARVMRASSVVAAMSRGEIVLPAQGPLDQGVASAPTRECEAS
jgi:nicotinamidase-related amidase